MADDNDVVTGETLSTYTAEKLGWSQEPAEEVLEGDGVGDPEGEPEKVAEVAEGEQEEDAEKIMPKPKSKLEQRMSELTNGRKAAETRAETAERELREFKAALKPAEPTPKVDPTAAAKPNEFPGRPDSTKYTDAYKYAEDLADWKVKAAFAAKDQEDSQKQQIAERQKVADNWVSRQKELEGEYPDYLEVANSLNVVVSDEVRDAIVESEMGPRILYYLGQNPDEAKRIAAMKMGPALKEIGRLEARLEPVGKADAEAKGDPKPLPKPAIKPSNAPAPIKPLNGKVVSDSRVDSDGNYTGDYEQYKADRAAGKIK